NFLHAAFLQGLQELGWMVGRNLRIDFRWGTGGDTDRLRAYAAELVALAPVLLFVARKHENGFVPLHTFYIRCSNFARIAAISSLSFRRHFLSRARTSSVVGSSPDSMQ